MTIADYLDSATSPEMRVYMEQCNDVWSNDAVIGYVLLAAKAADISDSDVQRLLTYLSDAFDGYSVDDAVVVTLTSHSLITDIR
jgi:hypothetical protein